jgi:hypothetical protein
MSDALRIELRTELQTELRAMADEDTCVRSELLLEGVLFQGYHPRMAEVHRRNAERLSAIMDQIGWPGRSQVGEEGARCAWLVLQHSIGNPAVMRRGLELVRQAMATGDTTPIEFAMLEDRIRSMSGLPQRYGTQFDWDEHGEMNPRTIEDPDGVDARRREMGLPPLADKIREIRQAMKHDTGYVAADAAARRRSIDAWEREVGWHD